MVTIQVVPGDGHDAYKLLRDKVTHEAHTWFWANKAKTKLRHKNKESGYIEVSSADGVLVAQIRPQESDQYFFVERFIGRLVAWFESEIVAINIQFIREGKKR